jgi:hypothetical protein
LNKSDAKPHPFPNGVHFLLQFLEGVFLFSGSADDTIENFDQVLDAA